MDRVPYGGQLLRYPSSVEEVPRTDSRAARILDGAAVARHLRERVRAEAEALGGRPAALRVILLGNDAASETYVAAKTKAAREAGIHAETLRLPSGSSPDALLSEVGVDPSDLNVSLLHLLTDELLGGAAERHQICRAGLS